MDVLSKALNENIDASLIPALFEFLKVPSCTPLYDPAWESNGLLEQAQKVVTDYLEGLDIAGFTHKTLKEPGRPPLFFGQIEATDPSKGSVVIYGHFDKQPPMEGGWTEGTGPYAPVIKDNLLFARAAIDDGYALMSAGLLIKTMQTLSIPHGRIFLIGENEEESGSPSLAYYLAQLKPEIESPTLILCLDCGTIDTKLVSLTTTVRGCFTVDVEVAVLETSKHSGLSGGIVPSPVRILNNLVSRIEDKLTGELKIPELHSEIPLEAYSTAAQLGSMFGSMLTHIFGLLPGVEPMSKDPVELLMNASWKPCMNIEALEGLPSMQVAGNLVHGKVKARMAFRTPPTVDTAKAQEAVAKALTENPPYNARVTVERGTTADGWASKPLSPQVQGALAQATMGVFGTPPIPISGGFSIPFLAGFSLNYPEAQVIATGVGNLTSNIHAPNENLDIEYLKKFMAVLGQLIGSI